MSVKIFTFEYCDKNNSIYISHNFNCHEQLFIRELSNHDVSYDNRCDYIEKHYLNNITYGLSKIKEDSFYLIMDELKMYKCECKFINIKDFDDFIPIDSDMLKNYDENEFCIEIKLNDDFRISDFIGELIQYGYFNTFYNDNHEFWVHCDVINGIKIEK